MTKYYSSVVECVAKHAIETPDKTAVITSDESVSYGQLWRLSRHVCDILQDMGLDSEARVLLQATHSIEYVAAYLGVTLFGAAAVPYEETLPQGGIVELADRVSAACVVALEDPGADIPFVGFAQVSASGNDSENIKFPEPDDLAELLFTTGTTGKSKTVMLSHRAVMSVERNIIEATKVEKDNVSLVPMPLNHVFALRRLQVALVRGSSAVLINGVASLKKFYGAIAEYGVTSLSLVPSALAYIEQTTKGYLNRFASQIRYVESSSAPLPSSTRSWLREVLPFSRLYNSYGCTESTACCMLEYSSRRDDAGCVGTPCTTAKITILDIENGGETDGRGRVAIGGSGVMTGYLDDQEATSSTLSNGYVLTNDLGYIKDGELYILGRIDDVVLIGGNNVSPDEIEDTLLKSELVADCACVGVHDDIAGDRLVLFVCPSTNGGAESDFQADVKAYLRLRLEPYKVPSEIKELDSIPRTYNGKTDRKILREMARVDA